MLTERWIGKACRAYLLLNRSRIKNLSVLARSIAHKSGCPSRPGDTTARRIEAHALAGLAPLRP